MSVSPLENRHHAWKCSALLARAIVGGLFLISAYGKIMAIEDFADEVRKYAILPIAWTNVFAYVLPWVELFAGLLLVITVWRKEARFLIALLLVIFTIAKAYAYARGTVIECGCGGGVEFLKYIYNNPQGIVTNIVLLALLAVDHREQRLTRKRRIEPGQPADLESTVAGEST